MLENPMAVMNWQNTMMYRVLRQEGSGVFSSEGAMCSGATFV
jgi:hypothetical protein